MDVHIADGLVASAFKQTSNWQMHNKVQFSGTNNVNYLLLNVRTNIIELSLKSGD